MSRRGRAAFGGVAVGVALVLAAPVAQPAVAAGPTSTFGPVSTAERLAPSRESAPRPPLDLPLSNADGERAGGVHPALPTDGAVLERMLDRARAMDVPPRRYAALLWQHWLVRAADAAGIGLRDWDPAGGVERNERTVHAVYTFYGDLFLANPRLQWAGMANMIGPSLAGGFLDLDALGRLGPLLAARLAEQPAEVRAALPREVRDLAEGGPPPGELPWFESVFLAMQKHVFMDQAAAHLAYEQGGLDAIREMRAAGLLDDKAVGAWRDIDSGGDERVGRGNAVLLDREQNQILPEQWNSMYRRHAPVGPALTYALTVVGSASIPGTRTPGQYAPLRVTGPLTGARLSTPLPAFNLADQDRRWRYIVDDTLPAYQRLLRVDPARVRAIVASPMEERVAEQRLSRRWPRVAAGLLTGWRLELPASSGASAPGVAARAAGPAPGRV
ncbi:hypothetical protein E0L36_10675 [Streptomyces sp. AJS327]|uniref:hypothetical protein n=1 Tax=Streptomyces sp. AJS327 TaxID=2545265 RepID=UPI0015DEF4CA|nr:hypothetical protein [Streptomyces sp. AJS327]MBA0051337.1 hypothetical protein [Streptomyces sp. AJS327]